MDGLSRRWSSFWDNTFVDEELMVLFRRIVHSGRLWDALIVSLGFMFFSLSFPFYPVPLILLLSIGILILGMKHPSGATVLGMVLNLPAISYQTPLLGWLFLLVISLTLFKLHRWRTISFLFIIIFSSFVPYPFGYLSFLSFFLMILFAMYLGSRDSILISIPSVLAILFLSAIWQTPNWLGLPVHLELYRPVMDELIPNRQPPEFTSLILNVFGAFGNLFNWDILMTVNRMLGFVIETIGIIFIHDTGIFEVLVFSITLYLISYIPAVLRRSRWKQTISSLLILIIPISHYALSEVLGFEFDRIQLVFAGVSVGLVFLLDVLHIEVSRERLLFLRKRARKVGGEFGLIDLEEAAPNIRGLDDVGDYEEVKEELIRTIVMPLEHPDISLAYGIKPPSGVLLFGPPGTGKTFIMTALAKELDMGFFYVKGSNLLSGEYGQTEKNITKLFQSAKANAPCILFFDEIDVIAKRRDMYTSDDIAPRVLSTLLQEMDGFKAEDRIIVVGATNVPHMIDPALLRPGRFDKLIYMPLPDREGRKEIFKVYLKKMKISKDVDIDRLADLTEGYTGADIKNVCEEASRLAAERALKKKRFIPVSMSDFEVVLRRVKPSVSYEELEKYELFKKMYDRSLYREPPITEEQESHVGEEGSGSDKGDGDTEAGTGVDGSGTGKGKKGKRTRTTETTVGPKRKRKPSFDDVVDMDDIKRMLKDAIELPFYHPELLKQYQVRPVKGILLFGPPGCGKTMIAKAAANEFDIPLFYSSIGDLVRHDPAQAAKEIKRVFGRARSRAPALILLDELDLLVSGSVIGEQVLNQLLTELDGVQDLNKVIVIGTSNRPWRLDPALLRPGRFDKLIYIPLPSFEVRRRLFINHLQQLGANLNYDRLAEETEGFSGADIVSVCQEVKLNYVRGLVGAGPKIKVDTDYVLSVIKQTHPSVSPDMITRYTMFSKEYERK